MLNFKEYMKDIFNEKTLTFPSDNNGPMLERNGKDIPAITYAFKIELYGMKGVLKIRGWEIPENNEFAVYVWELIVSDPYSKIDPETLEVKKDN